MHIKLGTRTSKLALAQANAVRTLILESSSALQSEGISVEIVGMTTRGDTERTTPLPAIGGKGLFTAELEDGLRSGAIDIAVHSLKDLPTELAPEFFIGAIPKRASPHDVLISSLYKSVSSLPPQALVGTSSPRRELQLRLLRPDLRFEDIRGNVDTRIRKVNEGRYAATILAEAGLQRLSLLEHIAYQFSFQEIVPAPGQGAIAVQCRAADLEIRKVLSNIEDPASRIEVFAERGFLAALGAGCSTPVGAIAVYSSNNQCVLRTRVIDPISHHVSEPRLEFSISLGEWEKAWQCGWELGRSMN